MSEDPDKTTEHDVSEARGAELRENIALTDARRTEEERAQAEEEAEKASKKAEDLSRKERQQREKAERIREAAERERSAVSGATVGSPGVGSATDPNAAAAAASGATAGGFPGADKLPPAAQRPEVLVGAAFVGSFLVARVLKRIFD
jgi:translation initiation factor IF-2